MLTALFVVVGYLAGSITFGYWIVRWTKGVDIRTVGSHNLGATNVWRTYGWRYGLPVMLLDVLKAFIPVVIATHVAGELAGVLTGAAAMAGHARPIYLKFAKGGKMVATAGGAFLGVAPVLGLVGAALWIVLFLVTRYASVASIVSGLAAGSAGLRARLPVAGDRLRRRGGCGRAGAAPGERAAAAERDGDRASSYAAGDVRSLGPSSRLVAELGSAQGRLGAGAHSELPADAPHVRLYCDFFDEQCLAYLLVRQPLADIRKNFSLACSEAIRSDDRVATADLESDLFGQVRVMRSLENDR